MTAAVPSAEAARLAFCGAVGDAVSGAGAGGRPPQAGTGLPSAPLCRGRQISSEPGFLFPCNPVFRVLLSPSPALFFLSWLWHPFRHLLSPPHCLPPVFLAQRALNVCLSEAHLLLVFTSAPRTRFLGLPALRRLSCWIVLVRCKQLRGCSVALCWGCSAPWAWHAALRLLCCLLPGPSSQVHCLERGPRRERLKKGDGGVGDEMGRVPSLICSGASGKKGARGAAFTSLLAGSGGCWGASSNRGAAGWVLASCSTCGAVEGCLGSAGGRAEAVWWAVWEQLAFRYSSFVCSGEKGGFSLQTCWLSFVPSATPKMKPQPQERK